MNSVRAVAILVLLLSAPMAGAVGPKPLHYELKLDVPITLAATAAWVGSELAKPRIGPETCRFCEPNALDAAVRNAVVWREPARARHASDALVFGVLPAAMIGHQLLAARGEGDWQAGFVDLLVVAEAAAIAQDLNQLVKFTVARERPFVHYGDPARPHEADDDVSFYSGHTTFAFALASSAGMVSTLRGYRSAPWVWGVGMSLAATAGWLRMGGDMHWFSDVLVGAVVGTAVGAGLPWLLHRDERGSDGPAVAASPAMVAFSFAF
ncbi:MAG TPA: phosphatase PAP2 family protein [Anaeromyxobacteraceae bacterium]|nr:phosphatase PAP2 family protein [Anaeromyxobacteraceae bacterium]